MLSRSGASCSVSILVHDDDDDDGAARASESSRVRGDVHDVVHDQCFTRIAPFRIHINTTRPPGIRVETPSSTSSPFLVSFYLGSTRETAHLLHEADIK